jgi:hypothetical protein
MHDRNKNLVTLLWTVIGVLVVGMIFITILLLNHASSVDQVNSSLKGNNDSLHKQLEQVRASSTPEPPALPQGIPPSPPKAK